MTAQQAFDEPTRPLRRSEYDQLIAAGAFDGERLELLEGRLAVMTPQSPPHAVVVQQLNELLLPALLGRAIVRVQLPLAVSDLSEPEPDIAVVAPGNYAAEHPTSALLVVEVADTSLRRDRDVKPALYAQAGVGEYWLVDLAGSRVVVQRDPTATGYRTVTTHRRGDAIVVAAFPDVTVAVDDVMPAG